MENSNKESKPVYVPIDGTLDLHTFHPSEVSDLVKDYLDECLKRGIHQVRIIHGKGKGVLRRIVHSRLEQYPAVVAFRHDPAAGSWGATIVTLAPAPDRPGLVKE